MLQFNALPDGKPTSRSQPHFLLPFSCIPEHNRDIKPVPDYRIGVPYHVPGDGASGYLGPMSDHVHWLHHADRLHAGMVAVDNLCQSTQLCV